jgi:hypothetical protein
MSRIHLVFSRIDPASFFWSGLCTLTIIYGPHVLAGIELRRGHTYLTYPKQVSMCRPKNAEHVPDAVILDDGFCLLGPMISGLARRLKPLGPHYHVVVNTYPVRANPYIHWCGEL